MRLLRLTKIVRVGLGQGLDRLILDHDPTNVPARFIGAVLFWRDLSAPRAERLRRALESLGPIFVKFGQVLSTRRDLLPLDVADELARLQDRVPPFPGPVARQLVEKAYGRPLTEVFDHFDDEPVASASIAQILGVRSDTLLGKHILDAIPDREISEAILKCLSGVSLHGRDETVLGSGGAGELAHYTVSVSRKGRHDPITIRFAPRTQGGRA